MIAPYLTGETLASFLALTFLEIVLSIDNIVFMALAIDRLAPERRARGRRLGLALAMGLRIVMLTGLVWLSRLDATLFHLLGRAVSIKDLVLIAGGLFLLSSGTTEIHEALDGSAEPRQRLAARSFGAVMLQVAVVNVIFSLDNVITAVGMTDRLAIMVAAVVVATGVMLFAAKAVGEFIRRRPTTKMLALSFILLIGIALVADGLGMHLPRGYIYFAIAFSLAVEMLNAAQHRARQKRPVDSAG